MKEAIIGVVGVVIGAVLLHVLNERAEKRRWRRDWTIERIRAMESYFGDVCEVLDDQFRVTGQVADYQRGLRTLVVPQDRVDEMGKHYGRVFARQGVSAPHSVQHALAAFDSVRADAAMALDDPSDTARLDAALAALDHARKAVLLAMASVQLEMNEDLAPLLLPRRVIWWRRRRGRSLAPEAIAAATAGVRSAE